ncbi:hypothetical protein BMYO_0166 [Bifidobacterium myosotis]|uniref:Uncharacterized protein n=1 Tax=Bifidobacterium myosotis TaxID=1630166 RepID=A0A261FR39_9BIFI|nr:helix-turn-helix domain-containing protein [Bifidobacterium myosotis]OZG61652.1 hypothetical protein BMYO_0166 [Bifidobacterium myosotis]
MKSTKFADETPIIRQANGHTSLKRLEPLKSATESLGLKDTRVTMRLVREGKLKAVKIGTRVLITSKSLNEFAGC